MSVQGSPIWQTDSSRRHPSEGQATPMRSKHGETPIHDVTTGSLICRYSRDVIRMRVTSEFALPEKRPRRAVPAHYQQPTAAGHGDSLARTHTRSPVSGSTPAAPPWLPPLGSRLMCHKTLASAGLNQILGLPGSLTRYPASSCSPPGSCKGD